jgi:hypothetical protein
VISVSAQFALLAVHEMLQRISPRLRSGQFRLRSPLTSTRTAVPPTDARGTVTSVHRFSSFILGISSKIKS